MKRIIVFVFAFLLLMTTCMALPSVEKLEINDNVINADGLDTFDVKLGSTLEIDVRLLGIGNCENVKVRAEILGYEHGDLTDSVNTFDLDDGDTTFKHLEITIPDRMEKQHYDLRVYVGDREGPTFEETYQIDIEGDRHNIIIRDVSVNDMYGSVVIGNVVKSGRTLFVNALLENIGEKSEEGVKVSVEIESLTSDSVYIDEIDNDKKIVTPDLMLSIPECAEGVYNLNLRVKYNDLEDVTVYSQVITISKSTSCGAIVPEPKPVVVYLRPPIENETKSDINKLVRGLEIVLISLVVILILLVLIIWYKNMKQQDRDNEVGQTYY